MKKPERNPITSAAYLATKGVISAVVDVGFTLFVLFVLIWAATNTLNIGTDATDLSGWNRSGMKLLIDHGTGAQYLSDGRGGMVRREFK